MPPPKIDAPPPTRPPAPSPKRQQLEQQRTQIERALKILDAQEQAAKRKADNRRAFVLGRILLNRFDADPKLRTATLASMDADIKAKTDRELFGLPESPLSPP